MSEVGYRFLHTILECPEGVSDCNAESAVAAGDRVGVAAVPDMPPANAWRLFAVERDRADRPPERPVPVPRGALSSAGGAVCRPRKGHTSRVPKDQMCWPGSWARPGVHASFRRGWRARARNPRGPDGRSLSTARRGEGGPRTPRGGGKASPRPAVETDPSGGAAAVLSALSLCILHLPSIPLKLTSLPLYPPGFSSDFSPRMAYLTLENR